MVPVSMRMSPIRLCSVRVKGFPEPKTIRATPRKDMITLCQTLRSTFSTCKSELKSVTNMNVVAKISEELPAVVREIP